MSEFREKCLHLTVYTNNSHEAEFSPNHFYYNTCEIEDLVDRIIVHNSDGTRDVYFYKSVIKLCITPNQEEEKKK